MKEKIGIIGLGYVGSPVQKWFKDREDEVFVYDKFKKEGSLEEVNKAEVIFVAVPTPFSEEGGFDISAVEESIEGIEGPPAQAGRKIIVIKSTIVPGSTKKLQKKFPKKIILYNPEFLRAKTAKEDYLHPNVQVVGYADNKGKEIAPSILRLLPKARKSKIMTATEAEVLKYWLNSYLATRVVFANEIFDLCGALEDAEYEVVKDCVIEDPRIGGSHWDIHDGGYRGYGGACFPKDVKSLIEKAEELGVDLSVVKAANKKNELLKKKK